jgi:four helix bundle protein
MTPELSDRLLKFTINVILLLRKFPNTQEYKIIKYQLIKSSSSSGANYEEAQGGSSRADFKNKAFISLKEMRESNYWLKVLDGVSDDAKTKEENFRLMNESGELKNILGSIVSKMK